MPSREVEFRLLPFVTNVAGDERVTVGLVHWDGGTLRTAWGPGPIPADAPAREARCTIAQTSWSYQPFLRTLV